MTLGLRDERQRRRRRFRMSVLKWIIALAIIAGAGVYAYEQAAELAVQDLLQLKDEKRSLEQQIADLRRENDTLQKTNQDKSAQIADWQKRYDQDVPSGERAALLKQVTDQLDSGVGADRLAFVIGAAKPDSTCDGNPVTKRFLVKTPLFSGANDSVGFVGNTITVTAAGESAVSATGAPEAWFDPAQPVSIVFTELGGSQSTAGGVLPLHHAIVRGGNEYRFTIVAGAQGFMNVTGDRCDYP